MKTFCLLVCFVLFAAGCATPPADRSAQPPSRAALSTAPEGDHQKAALAYLRLANDPSYPDAERQQFRLQAAEAMSYTQQATQALQLTESIDPTKLGQDAQTRLQLLKARAWYALRNAERTLQMLAITPPSQSANELLDEYHRLRGLAYTQLGNHLEAAREYVWRGHCLFDEKALTDNQQQLWHELGQLSAEALRALRHAPPPDEFSGWLALAEISKQYQLGPSELQPLIEDWHLTYPWHPAEQSIIDNMLRRSDQLVLQAKQIALLLPLSGRFANAGKAVRDGVLAAYYHTPAEQRVDIRIHDTAEPAQVLPAYAQAVEDGADFIIGPLNKESVAALLERHSFPVTTLILNASDHTSLPENIYQLDLAPEEEAAQVAERAWLHAYNQAAILVPKGEWGERLAQAFSQRWQELGGKIASQIYYDAKENDFAQPLRRMLNLDLSSARQQQVRSVVKRKIYFEPRRRQDIDFVFLAAFPRQARLIRPQLRFHRASDLPVLATSHVYSGAISKELDRDMDDIIFADMPWALKTTTPNQGIREDSLKLSIADNSLQRLLALGVDSYNLISVLKVLEEYPYERFQGETGTLHLNAQRQLQRQLSWAQFKGGLPQALQQVNTRDDGEQP